MAVAVAKTDEGHRLVGEGPATELANSYLAHLTARGFAVATVRGYAFDLLNFSRFLQDRDLAPGSVAPSDLFDWLQWQSEMPTRPMDGKFVKIQTRRGASPATMNRRVAAVRGLFEYSVISS